MPIVTTNFIKGRMNKSVDERLLPPGEYVDAMNLRLGATETTEIGAIENSKGNTKLTSLSFPEGTPLSSNTRCIGAYQDHANETLYWFIHDDNNPTLGVLDAVVSYNTNGNSLRYHVITNKTLNFDPAFLITGVEKIEDLLFFTDDKNPPRKINITQSYPFPVGGVDQTVEEDLNVIVKPPGYEFDPATTPAADVPLPAPKLRGLTLPGSENYIEDRFLCFAYRYRYSNNEYSAISLFSKPAFATSPFVFNIKNYNNDGMSNRFNAVNVTFNTGSKRVNEVDLLFKDTSNNNIYVIERFNKEENGWANNAQRTFQFNNSKVYSVLGSDELLRLYDNVPKVAKALTIMGNRLIYGNYKDGYDITNENNQKIALDYTTTLVNKNVDFVDLENAVTLSNGDNYTIDPNNTVTATNAVIEYNLSSITSQLKANSILNFSLLLEHSTIGGTETTDCFVANSSFTNGTVEISFNVVLENNYNSVYDLSQSSEFRNAIGTEINVNFQPIATANQGGSITDKFNNDLALPSTTCTFTKALSGIDDATAQQPFRITALPGSDVIKIQTIAMKFTSPDLSQTTDLYEYFRVADGEVVFSSLSDTGSLHSNRDFQTGIVYLDSYGRASTVLTSNFNTVSVSAANSINVNQIKATVNNFAPSWAERYKFVVKPSKANYETIFSNFYYTVQTSQVTYFKLEGDNQNKVKTGDTLIVKTDVSGFVSTVVKAKVLNVQAQARDFLNDSQGMGVDTAQLPGLYMEIKPQSFNVNIPDDSTIEAGRKSYESTGDDGRCRGGVNYPLFVTPDSATPSDTDNYTIPAGSAIEFNIEVYRNGRSSSCEGMRWEWKQVLYSSQDYPDFRRWWVGDNINPGTASPGTIEGEGGDFDVVYKTAVGSYSAGVGNVECTSNSGESISDNSVIFQFLQDAPGDVDSKLGLGIKTKKPGCAGFQPIRRRRNINVKAEITVTRANTLITFETEPLDASEDIFYDASDSYVVKKDVATGNYLHMSGGDATDQDQTTSSPAIVTLPFIDCFTFGNGVESFKINDDFAGRALTMGQRVLAVSQQDFKEAHRFADLTYSGIFSSNAGVNNLNEFNLGLANFKELETSFGPIQKLYARETDILTLQEDKISYVLASKNLISDATGGGAIISSPTILGTQIARTEEYGISFNPESFGAYGDSYYFTDTKRVAVIKLIGNSQNDQLQVISDMGMRSWFRDNFQLALQTQKLGGYDPYMDEYVLSTNDVKVPVPPVVYQCGAEFQTIDSSDVVTYTLEFGETIGNIVVDYIVTSGTIDVSVKWNNNTVSSGNVTTDGSVTVAKTLTSPTTAVVTVTPSGKASFAVTPNCVPEQLITVFKCVINSNIDSGSLIHVEYGWTDTTTISPIDTDQITMGSNDLLFSFFESQTGVRSQGVYPYDGSSLNMRINKLATDDYNFKYPNDNFKFLSSSTLYGNTTADVAALLAAAAEIPNASVSNPTGTEIRQATVGPATTPPFTLPNANQYLYLIYDFRFTSAQKLCYSTSASEACCDCVIPCNSFSASTRQTTRNTACQQPLTQIFYYASSGGLALYDIVYSDAQCAGNAPGQNVNTLTAGFYKITGNEYIRVNQFGLVIEKTTC